MSSKVKILILAGGKGNRMRSDTPKALLKVHGEPIIKRLISSVKASGADNRPSIVVGYGKEVVMKEVGDGYDFIVQNEQLGTGHAVMVAQGALENKAENIVVLYSDHPLVSPETIRKLVDKHIASGAKITLATVKLGDFADWRKIFYTNFSRIIRDDDGNIIKDVQFKDASEEEKKITEVNPCYFCFEARFLWTKLKTLSNNNAQKEYYLTDLIRLAIDEGEKIESININGEEALGVNSREELEILEKLTS